MILITIYLSGTVKVLSLEIGRVSLFTRTIKKETCIVRALQILTLFSACRVLEFIRSIEAYFINLIKIQTVKAVKDFHLNELMNLI